MPAPAVTAGLIAAGSSLVGQGIGAISQGSMNRKTRKWNEKMYGIQRRDAIADWNMQNQYNSPLAQMQRLREAGLNPMLVYKNGADNVAPAVRSTSVDSWNPSPVQFDPGKAVQSGLQAYFDVEMKTAQVDNLHEQNKILQQESVNKAIDAALKISNIERLKQLTTSGKWYLERDQQNLQTFLAQAKENLFKTQVGNFVSLASNERANLLTANRLTEGIARVLLMRAQTGKIAVEKNYLNQVISNLKKDAVMKQLDIDLMKLGINPRVDGIKERIAGRVIAKIQNNATAIKQWFNPPAKPIGGKNPVGSGLQRRYKKR